MRPTADTVAHMSPLADPITLDTPVGTVSGYAHGAHVTSWFPTGEQDVLWMSAKSAYDSAAPLRGGIPICLPWFGAGASGALTPVHGFARISRWRLVESARSDEGGHLAFQLSSADIADGLWPYAFTATYRVHAGTRLTLGLTMRNDGDEAFAFEEALHTYFTVGDVRTVSIDGLDGARYLDKVSGQAALQQAGPVTITAETDRVYDSEAEVVIIDPTLGRRIRVRKSGSASTVVWNPWIAKSAAMPDFGDDEWPGMVCVETGNVLGNAIELAPGASHTLGCEISVER